MGKRIFLFIVTNIAVVLTLTIVLRILGVDRYVGPGGLNIGALAGFSLVWGMTGAFTTFALMIIAPQRSPNFMTLSLLVVPALAAALVGVFRSFWWTLAGGIALGIVEGLASSIDSVSQYRSAIPFLVVLAVLLWSQREARWDEAR